MAYEDQVLTCVDCGQEFTFTASQRESFEQKGLTPPKRCYECRVAKRQRGGPARRGGRGPDESIYRSPAFRDSAPEARGRGGGGRGGSSGPARPTEYRSPAFRDVERRGEGIYRAPAFRDQGGDEAEYRSPAFREHTVDAASEYRAPGFQDQRKTYTDDRPMFLLICSTCGERSMVPFLPDEQENPVCDACHAAERRAAAEPVSAAKQREEE